MATDMEKEFQREDKFKWGDIVTISPEAPAEFHPNDKGVYIGKNINDDICLVEFVQWGDVRIPLEYLILDISYEDLKREEEQKQKLKEKEISKK